MENEEGQMDKQNRERPFNQPLSGLVTPRFAGIATFMRLPQFGRLFTLPTAA